MHVIRFSGNERLSERLSWRLFGRLRRKRIGRLKAVREVRERGFVTGLLLWVVVLLDAGVEVLLDAGVVVLILGSNRDVICLAQ